MGEGLRLLFGGMFDAIMTKSISEGVPFESILRRELVEIPRINAEIQGSPATALQMFAGLNVIALSYFQDLAKNAPDGSIDKSTFMTGVESFISMLENVEDYSLQVPLAASSSQEMIAARASTIGKWARQSFDLGKSNSQA